MLMIKKGHLGGTVDASRLALAKLMGSAVEGGMFKLHIKYVTLQGSEIQRFPRNEPVTATTVGAITKEDRLTPWSMGTLEELHEEVLKTQEIDGGPAANKKTGGTILSQLSGRFPIK